MARPSTPSTPSSPSPAVLPGIDAPARRAWAVSDDPGLVDQLAHAVPVAELAWDTSRLTGGQLQPWCNLTRALTAIDLRRAGDAALLAIGHIRRTAPGMAVLALLAEDGAPGPGDALAAGAHDFCLLPLRTDELWARIQRLVAPLPPAVGARLVVGDLELDPHTRTARRAGQRLVLSVRQYELLELLMRHAGQVLSRERIESALQFPPRQRASNVVEVHIHHLRRRIGPGRLSTLRGRGYLLHAAAAAGATERTLRE